jgi:hypothetical protein
VCVCVCVCVFLTYLLACSFIACCFTVALALHPSHLGSGAPSPLQSALLRVVGIEPTMRTSVPLSFNLRGSERWRNPQRSRPETRAAEKKWRAGQGEQGNDVG